MPAYLHGFGLSSQVFPFTWGKVGDGTLRAHTVYAQILTGCGKGHVGQGEDGPAVRVAHLVLVAGAQRHLHHAVTVFIARFLHNTEHGGEFVFFEHRSIHIDSPTGFLFRERSAYASATALTRSVTLPSLRLL